MKFVYDKKGWKRLALVMLFVGTCIIFVYVSILIGFVVIWLTVLLAPSNPPIHTLAGALEVATGGGILIGVFLKNIKSWFIKGDV
jgi:hypothetical protein